MAPKNSPHKFLVCINGSYGDRMLKIAQVIGVNAIALRYQDNEIVRAEDVQA
jgi:aspartate aminotransferase-like enzyme